MVRHHFESPGSRQTLREGLAEYFAANPALKRDGDLVSPEARLFFRCHDTVHVVYGRGTTMVDEAVVKLATLWGTTGGRSALRGYRLHESLDIYRHLDARDTAIALLAAPYLLVRTAWRCSRQASKWPWADHDQFLETPLCTLRERFGIRVTGSVRDGRT